MIALSATILMAIWLVTGQASWVFLFVIAASGVLLVKKQWLEFAVLLVLCGQLVALPQIEPLQERGEQQQLQFTITSVPVTTESGCRAYAKLANGERWLVTMRTKTQCEFEYGMKMLATGVPTPIQGLQNFQLFQRSRFYTRQKQIRGELQVKAIHQREVATKRYEQQLAILSWIDQRIGHPEGAILFKAMILGETSEFSEDVRAVWQTLNISHILAISGLHAAIFITLIRIVCRRCHILKHWHPWIIGGILLLLRWYNFASVSFTRVVCMWFISLLLGKRWSQYQKLLIASAIVGLLWPQELLGIGYYYSFSCALLLTLGRKLWQKKWGWFAIPFTLQLWLLPITLWQTGSFLPVSLLANMLAIPFVTLLLPLLLVMLLFPFSAEFVVWFYHCGVFFFEWLLEIAPWTLTLGQLTLLSCIIILGGLYLGYYYHEHRAYYRCVFVSFACMSLVFINFWRQPEVTMVDIGQGDATVILDERRKAFVIDTGGPSKLETDDWQREPVVEAYLKQRGVRQIETLVITHGDLDHLGYSLALFAREDIRIENLVLAAMQNETPEEQQLLQLATKLGTNIHFVQEGTQIQFGKLQFSVLSPVSNQRVNINNHSLVLWSQIGGLNWLFTGDIEQSVEHDLVKRYPDLPVDVLKVAHHGSKTSTSLLFLLTYQPKYALISAGRNNRFNHPHPTITKRLADHQVMTVTTSEVGMIRFRPWSQQWECVEQALCFQ